MPKFQIILIKNSRPKQMYQFDIRVKDFVPITRGGVHYFECSKYDADKLLRNLQGSLIGCKLYLNELLHVVKS